MFISQKKNRQSDGSLVISDNEATAEVTEPSKNYLEDSLMCENEKTESIKHVSNNNGSNNSSIIPSKHLWKGSSLNKSMQTSSLDGISSPKPDTKVCIDINQILLFINSLFLSCFSVRTVLFT